MSRRSQAVQIRIEAVTKRLEAIERAQRDVAKLGQRLDSTSRRALRYGKNLDTAGRHTLQLQRRTASLSHSMRTGLAVGVFNQVAAGAVRAARSVGRLVSRAIEFNATLEQHQVAFTVLLRDAEAAEKRVQQLFEFSKVTPYLPEQVVATSRLLQALAGDALASGDGLRLVGDAAAATGRNLQETAMWVGRLYAGLRDGAPVGEATLRLLEMGLVSGQTKRKLDDLAKTAQGADRAWQLLDETFGGFEGAMQQQSETFKGLMSTLAGGLDQILGGAFSTFFDEVKGGLRDINELLDLLPDRFERIAGRIRSQTDDLATRAGSFTSTADALDLQQQIGDALREARRNAATTRYDLERNVQALNDHYNLGTPVHKDVKKNIKNFTVLLEAEEDQVARLQAAYDKVADAQAIATNLVANNLRQSEEDWRKRNEALEASREEVEKSYRVQAATRQERIAQIDEEIEALRQQSQIYSDHELAQKKLFLDSQDLLKERAKLEREITAEKAKQQQTLAREIAALAKIEGLRAIGGGRFVRGDLSKTEQARAGVRGQDVLAYNEGSKSFGATGDLSGGLADPTAHFQSIGEGALAAVYEYQAAIGTLGDQVNNLYLSTFETIEQGIAGSIEGLLDGTMSWADALQNIRSTILAGIISSISEMAAEWITQQIVMATVGRQLRAASTTESTAAAAAQTAAWTPAAIASSIATLGGALAAGAAVTALIAGFKDGGPVYGPGGPRGDRIPAMLSDGEYVINAAATAQHRPLLDAINTGAPAPGSGSAPGGAGGSSNVILAWTDSEVRRAVEASIGDDYIVSAVLRNKTTLGLR